MTFFSQKNFQDRLINLSQVCMLIKLSIDIHETYGKLFGSPPFKYYRNEVLPMALDFYNKINQSLLTSISETFRKVIKGISCNILIKYLVKTGILNMRTKEAYVTYYEKESITYSNLTEGCSSELYYI